VLAVVGGRHTRDATIAAMPMSSAASFQSVLVIVCVMGCFGSKAASQQFSSPGAAFGQEPPFPQFKNRYSNRLRFRGGDVDLRIRRIQPNIRHML